MSVYDLKETKINVDKTKRYLRKYGGWWHTKQEERITDGAKGW